MGKLHFVFAVLLLFLVEGLPVAAAPPKDLQAAGANSGDTFADDPTTRTWLPIEPATRDRMRLLACWYNGSTLTASREFTDGTLKTSASKWTSEVTEQAVPEDSGARDLQVHFKLTDGEGKSAGVAVAFDFANWSAKNYVLVPASIYNGNRFHALGGGYMPVFPPEMYFNPKLPLTMSNNPRLSVEPGKASKIELLTGNAATPAICFYSPHQKRGFILLTDQQTRFGNSGVFIEENAAQDEITFAISAPGVREKAAHFGGFGKSGDVAADWNPGDEVTLKFRIYSFPADGIPALLERFMTVRKALTGPNRPRNLAPMSQISQWIGDRYKRRWTTPGNYYAPERGANYQLGWVSGFMQTPLLALDEPTERQRMCLQFDFVIGKLQGKSGYFFGGIKADGKLWADRSFNGRTLALTRKDADVLLSFFKFFQILKAQGHGDVIQPEWEQSAKRLAQAFVNTWNTSGEFGNYVDPQAGEIGVYNTTGGAIVPAGLALASKYFNEPEFLRVAKASADFYYTRDVVGMGLTSGHVGDTGQDPDSESAYGFLESLMALYWATGDPAWLDKARTEANLAATWTLSYDETFPPRSQLAKLGAHVAGAVFANTQNKHAAPGICTASGDYVFKLYRATGDVRYAELIRDIQHAHVEATEMPSHPTCGVGVGASMERIQPTDGEGKRAVGNFVHVENGWTEMNGWMMAIELPGIYLQTDSDRLFVFDSVEAKVVSRDGSGVKMEIHNPTKYDADITVFAENEGQAKVPLSYTAYLGWPKVSVRAGATLTMTISHDAATLRSRKRG